MVDISTPAKLLRIISGSSRYVYYTEMHHGQAILHNTTRLDWLIGPPRPNMVVQLGGAEPSVVSQAAKVLELHGYKELNINVGCPSPNVQAGMFGAVLMKTPHIVADILTAMQTAEVSIPVTIKCRIGVDTLDSFEFLEHFVNTLLESKRPPPHLVVHARKCILKGLSPKQNRSVPPLMYDRVFQLRDRFPDLPLSINGGFDSVDKVKMALEQVDGCMIGRKIMNSPLFLQTLDREIYNIDESNIKTTEAIIHEYLGERRLETV
ncbi:tRNA-dihydrouridine synthase [Spinellus fusiger]|nr:tRNA-dihydrouridine synthase [Spinellus fusiger]